MISRRLAGMRDRAGGYKERKGSALYTDPYSTQIVLWHSPCAMKIRLRGWRDLDGSSL